MTPDPTTREGRDELRQRIAGFKRYLAAPIVETAKDDVANAVRPTFGWLALVEPAMLDAFDDKDAEIACLNAQLTKLRDGIAEVVTTDGFFRLHTLEIVEDCDPSPAGAKLAQLWRESRSQETK